MTTNAAEPARSGISRSAAVVYLLLVAAVVVVGFVATLPEIPYSHLFHDELHYAQAARDIADGGLPHYNRNIAPKYPPLYGAALAPVRAAAGRDGFAWWARVINVLLAVSALIPAYRLARLTLPRGWAVAAAVLCLVGSHQVYLRMILSENLFTPLFLWCTWALVRACRRPTVSRALPAGLLFGFAVLTKSLVIVVAPAVVLTVVWSVREVWPTVKTLFWIGIGGVAPVYAWQSRELLFPAERELTRLFSYINEFTVDGLQSPGEYVHWIRVESGAWVVALAAPVLVLGLAGLFARLFEPRSRKDRSFAAFTLLSSIGITAFAGIWMAQIAFYKEMVQERYLACLWPLIALAFVDRLARPGGRRVALGLAVALVVGLIVTTPAVIFQPGAGLGQLPDFPSALQSYRLADLGASDTGARLLLLLPLLALPLLGVRRKLGVALVLLLALVHAGSATQAAYKNLLATESFVRKVEEPAVAWLAQQRRPGDKVICHGFMWNTDYRICMRLELPFSQIAASGEAVWESDVLLNRRLGRYEFRSGPPPERILFLTRDPKVAPGREYASFNGFRIIELEGGRIPDGLAIKRQAP